MFRTSIVGALLLGLLPAVSAQQSPVATPDASPWPPPGVYPIGQGVTAPRLVTKVKPLYTGDAMRAKIQGIARLSCVVEPDGTVGPVRIVGSLDAVHGLDDEAVKAVTQWRFTPGTRNNMAVRVVVNVDLTFTLRDGRYPAPLPAASAPRLTWPEGFGAITDTDVDKDAWLEDRVDVSGLQIKVGYPRGWRIQKNVTPPQLLVIHNSPGTHSVSIMVPRHAESPIDGPATPESLEGFAHSLQSAPTFDQQKVEMLSLGQAQTADHFWIWLNFRGTTSVFPSDQVKKLFDTLRLWTFTTTVGTQMITVNCVIAVPRDANDAQRDEQLQQATSEFGGIMRRLAIGFR